VRGMMRAGTVSARIAQGKTSGCGGMAVPLAAQAFRQPEGGATQIPLTIDVFSIAWTDTAQTSPASLMQAGGPRPNLQGNLAQQTSSDASDLRIRWQAALSRAARALSPLRLPSQSRPVSGAVNVDRTTG
jgi:hypothetical protein